jgi:GntR family transcriptional regulator/MocR family aminotransferase
MQFWQEKAACPPNTLFLGFSKIDFKDIPDCVTRLKAAWVEWL